MESLNYVVDGDDILAGAIVSPLVASVSMMPAPSTVTSFSLVACSFIPTTLALSFKFPKSLASLACAGVELHEHCVEIVQFDDDGAGLLVRTAVVEHHSSSTL